MKQYLLSLIIICLLFSCNQSDNKTANHDRITVVQTNTTSTNSNDNKGVEQKDENTKQLNACHNYWKRAFPNDSIKKRLINEIISVNNSLTENNIKFLNSLKEKKDELAFNNVLAPIFRLSSSEIGIFAFVNYKFVDNKYVPFSREEDLIGNYRTTRNVVENSRETKFYKGILDSLYGHNKPTVYYYGINKTGSTKIIEIGESTNECVEYFEYSIDTTTVFKYDKLLFSSPLKIDLVFENNRKVDILLQNDDRKECYDCPSSNKLQKSFARVKGTSNLYFVYADTFPLNNKLDTPSRALILINSENEIVYLWNQSIDLFECSCL